MKQLIEPNLMVKVQPGWCLGYVSDVLGIRSNQYARAWQAWEGSQYRHGPNEPLPTDAGVLVYFDHWGDYGEGWGRYGHVAYHLPGQGVFSSPTGALGSPASFAVFRDIASVVRTFNAPYVGWTEDLAGVRFAAPDDDETQGEETMPAYLITTDTGNILMVDHAQMTYWNVHEGLPAELVGTRLDWLRAQGAFREVSGRQPAGLLSGYRNVAAPVGAPAPVAQFAAADVKAIAKAVNDDMAERMKK